MSLFRDLQVGSLACGGFYQLASIYDFKYHSVRLKLMHSVGQHQAVQNSRPTPVLCQIVSSPYVGMYRIIAFCLIC